MPDRPRPPKPEKPREPDYTWAVPSGAPPVLWEHAARPLWAQALPAHDAVFLMEKERWLARRASTGETLWERTGTQQPDEVAQDAGGLVIGAARDLRELHPGSGEPRWRVHLGAAVTGLELDPAHAFATSDGPLFAVDRKGGKVVWKARVASDSALHPLPQHGLLLVADTEDELLRAFDVPMGIEEWTYGIKGQPIAVGPAARDTLWLSAHEEGVVAVDLRTGEERGRLPTERSFETPGVAMGDHVFFTDGTVHAVPAAPGAAPEAEWTYTLQDDEDGIFALRAAGDLLLAESWRGRLLALDPADGSLRWERRPGQVHGAAWDDRTLYFRVNRLGPEEHWAVVALDRATGDLQWELHAPRLIPDVTVSGSVLVVELRTRVLVLDGQKPTADG